MSRAKILKLYTKIYAFFHKIQKKILFISYAGLQYADSPRAICDKMHEMYPEYQLVWAFNDPDGKKTPSYITKISYRSLAYYRNLATCCAFVTNEDLHEGQFKRTGQYFVQTWHGDRPFKKVLYEIGNNLDYRVVDNELTDLCVAGSKYGERLYRNAFRYDGEILTVGMPRNDILINRNMDIQDLKHELGIEDGWKVIMYAPTFRDGKKAQSSRIDIVRLLRTLNTGKEQWVCLVRAHAGVDTIEFSENHSVIDVSSYDEISYLYLMTDVLITDYSTCATDYILLKRPTIIMINDIEEYKKECRELMHDFLDTGFIFVRTQNELENLLMRYKEIDSQKEYELVDEYFKMKETGRASESVCLKIDTNVKKGIDKE